MNFSLILTWKRFLKRFFSDPSFDKFFQYGCYCFPDGTNQVLGGYGEARDGADLVTFNFIKNNYFLFFTSGSNQTTSGANEYSRFAKNTTTVNDVSIKITLTVQNGLHTNTKEESTEQLEKNICNVLIRNRSSYYFGKIRVRRTGHHSRTRSYFC